MSPSGPTRRTDHVRRGEIYWADLNPVRGSEQGGIRPALVVQQDLGNANSDTTVVVAITRTIPPKPYPFTVVVEPADSGLPERSCVNCSQVKTIQCVGPDSRLVPPRGSSVATPIGRLAFEKMAEVEEALRYNLGL